MFARTNAHFAAFAAASVALAACSGGAGTAPVPLNPAGAALYAPDARPNAVKARLLYASAFSTNAVTVLEYPSGKPAGTLTGFSNPQGMCADTADHNVFIANTGAENVLEYAYGASSPRATYPDPGGYPVACSIDPTTGNLAIANILSPTSGIGGVTICKSPSHCRVFSQPGEVYSIAYVGNGDLYVDNLTSFGFAMAYLPAGGSTWKPVNYSGPTVNFPGGLQWDGKYLAIGDQSGPSGYSVIYRCAASGPSIACDDRRVDLLTSSDVVEFFIKYGDQGVVGADAATASIATWPYPAGGNPSKVLHPGHGSASYAGMVVLRKS